MLVYGTNSSNMGATQVEEATCFGCNTKGSLVFTVSSKYVHIFWIPIFPYRKYGYSQCLHCHEIVDVKHMSLDHKKIYSNLYSDVRKPSWPSVGVGIILRVALGVIISNEEDNKNELSYIAHPLIGDIYEFEIEEGSYSTMRVSIVDTDSVYVNFNEYETNMKTGIDEVHDDGYYNEMLFGISRIDLQEMYDEEDIFNILRK